ncbi:TetR/AcrR family transcriptional regulator [Aeromicrobium fastidiosum]|uniref:TetR/AcrR family transcriptional regulator n=1 Tax=Aeromicrobium fastidiosum TaxID=52699 RepID=A0A641ARN0_9ACTN|nr:TetR/AcrR family transcriptional regulator [Aeromicrobium fastidiosum]KAA1380599.1 TetR/AcrR family transcriptional regulator [Aeromicrobium fastidiosum]MBP2390198.1 AcrR family transcriptional regulator [Aeromicrobium fastidiosum]
MGRTAGRSPDGTRRVILDAAADALVQRGRSASLADIARAAGVTKGGLLYHFGSKEDLLVAVATDIMQSYEDLVEGLIDPDDHEPGRFCRAYVRSCFVPWTPSESAGMSPIVMAMVLDEPRTVAVVGRFTDRLDERLRGDRLPDEIVAVVVAAADGASMQPLWWAGTDPVRRSALEQQLLAMTHQP